MGREGALLLDPNKQRSTVRDGVMGYPGPADMRAESQAPVARLILLALPLP